MSSLDDHSSTALTPADRLPPELLIEIFRYSVVNDSEQLVPLVLSSVSRYWRGVACSSPRVWQYIYLSDSRRLDASHAQARLWLYRSGPLPVYVHVSLQTRDMLLPLLSPMLPALYRWSLCEINLAERWERTDFSTLPFDYARSRLKSMSIVTRAAEDAPDNSPDGAQKGMVGFHFTPTEDAVPQYDVTMNVSLCTIPRPQDVGTIPITRLTIAESHVHRVDVSSMLHFLTVVPMLESFTFQGRVHFEGPVTVPSHSSITYLPYLRLLALSDTCATRTILSHIDAPSLTELYLTRTNVEFELKYTGMVEDGDSDDEAQDYSQSPWSDRATGMGLRTLIRRSKPPLRVLGMDYADMRTKDFQWCFERMDRLEEFRIVASDMSNTVIKLLGVQPFNEWQPTDGVPSENYGLVRVRLPRLSFLALWYCQQLAGAAIMEVLRSRVLYTDANADDDSLCRLEQVTLGSLPGLQAHHAGQLTNILGDRLHVIL